MNSRMTESALIDLKTAELPKILWIELTSKCPFDCVFCSRKTLRGAGEHMDFGLYSNLIGQLRAPESIRLNYSGESVHYPQLLEAIRLAHETGAFTEMVSAFASYPQDRIEDLVLSGLDRLTVSLHTMEDRQFARLYRFSSLWGLQTALWTLRQSQRKLNRPKPLLDFAFVALQENLSQLSGIAEYARELGVRNLSVHPVIRRAEIPVRFDKELAGDRLRPEFKKELSVALQETAARFPELEISLSTPELQPDCPLGRQPRRYAGYLPEGARIHSCDQNPWETAHILSNGDVVACEVQDRIVLGNLWGNSLAEIWNGGDYRRFRQRYWMGEDRICKACPYKLAYYPSKLEPKISARNGNNTQLLRGWHPSEEGIIWSKQWGDAVLSTKPSSRVFQIRGILPPSTQGGGSEGNELSIQCNGRVMHVVTNHTKQHAAFDLKIPLPRDLSGMLLLRFWTKRTYHPASVGEQDVRELGFALEQMNVE